MGTHYKGKPAEVRALDAYIKLLRATHTVQSCLDATLAEAGLTSSQFGVLEMLFHLGPQQQQRIGRGLLLSRANVTLLVDRLEELKLVRRERDPDDRRAIRVHLTAEGRRMTSRLFPAHLAEIVGVFSALSAREQTELARLCRKLGLANRS